MSDAVIFVGFFGLLFVLRVVAATVFFYYILPQGDRCPNCDAPTIRVHQTAWNTLFPFLRTSWCIGCGWEGILRLGPITAPAEPAEQELTKFG
jgi:hypothetical protein